MKVRTIKAKIYSSLRLLIFWRKRLFIYRRVRVTQGKIAQPVESKEVVQLPDLEMWAIYQASGVLSCLHLTEEGAAVDCLEKNKRVKKGTEHPKSKLEL